MIEAMDQQHPSLMGNGLSKSRLIGKAVIRFGLLGIVMALLVFLPAGTIHFWQAWVYIAILYIPMLFVLAYLVTYDPSLLDRRLRMKEKEKDQNIILIVSYVIFLGLYIFPGFDHRYGWSNLPAGWVFAADIIVLAGYLFFFFVLRENSYASRIIEVDKEQQLITSGPYSLVRHPMYVTVLMMWGFTPLALGSGWGMLFSPFMVAIIIRRIYKEEDFLRRNLEGYEDYCKKTKYRLLPGIW
jgi:protein-S-isoprenylcysteine O-methyltransferase Ste14